MTAPKSILVLVERFSAHREAYRAGAYNETQLRREFLDPFFEALGWDVSNKQGNAEAYKDVVHEDAIKVGGFTKAPDYSFRIGGVRKFFVEAKKPSVDVKGDPGPAFQLRRYAWSAKLPLSILTDFEEFAVYDCRLKPSPTDKPSLGRLSYFRFEEYAARWEEIAGVYSREAILKGSFDKYAEARKGKRGTAEVDGAFLEEIEGWRDLLARHIALRNPKLSVRELNFAVQRIVDRIIFLRICEDRGIEDYGRLQALENGEHVYQRLVELFQRADDRYNSGIFGFREEKGRQEPPDTLTPRLHVDDEPLKTIIRDLYYPHSPYEFSVLPADILGQVYERFLGKVIRLTPTHRAVVEEKPEVKKAGGVYYTPTYVVDYIVEQTVGKLLDRATPTTAAKLKILDPACGSGSFLIAAYQRLLNWHRDWYVADGPQRHKKVLYQGRAGEWRLTTAERKRILVNNIFGVDIDPQAVEVTKLSLLLKVLEGESQESLHKQFWLLHERALPDLGSNVRCGNSLVGPDFYRQSQLELLEESIALRVNAFEWTEEFALVFSRGGFDAVIGNPPYVRMEGFAEIKPYLAANYSVHDERTDLYAYFLERGLQLLRKRGRLGMIVSNKFLRARYGERLRRLLRSESSPEVVLDLAGVPVFAGATVRTIVFVTGKEPPRQRAIRYCPPPSVEMFGRVRAGVLSLQALAADSSVRLDASALSDEGWLFERPGLRAIREKMLDNGLALEKWLSVPICYGVKSGLTEAFVVDRRLGARLRASSPADARIVRPFVFGREIRRYGPINRSWDLIYTPKGADISDARAVLDHLAPFRQRLLKRATKQRWYELQQSQERYVALMEGPKIVYPDIASECRFAMDQDGHICDTTAFAIPSDDVALLALLNSRAALFYFRSVCAGLEGPGGIYLRFKLQYVAGFPVPTDLPHGARELRALGAKMLSLTGKAIGARTDSERQSWSRRAAAVDRRIDAVVSSLYRLTPAEAETLKVATQ